jgi:aspartate/glutamate racemase
MPVVTLVHAVLPALAPMQAALNAALPDVKIRHILDEGLSSEAERRGGVDRACIDRMLTVLRLAVEAGTDAVLLTCTAYSTMLPEARTAFAPVPFFAVDQMMVETAVRRATRIGVLATFASGLEQQRAMLTAEAAAQGRTIEIVPSLHPAAFDALRAGNAAEHDRIVLDALPALADGVEIVLLAQASMSRVADRVPERYRERVLSSPLLAAQALKTTFEGLTQRNGQGAAS